MPSTTTESSSRLFKATKSVCFRYTSSEELTTLFEDFRLMCNDALQIALDRKPKNRFELIEVAYAPLKQFGLHSHYTLSACEVAYSIYKNKNRKSVPHVKNSFIKLDCQSYQLDHLILRIPKASHNFIFLTLAGSSYHLTFIDNPQLKRGSVTITKESVSIAFTKYQEPFQPTGHLGVDVNERNVTMSATNGHGARFNELGEAVEIKERYREIRAKISNAVGSDKRIGSELLSRYGRRERNRTEQRVHAVTKAIVEYSAELCFGIKLEKLKGIQKLFRKGNDQGPFFRGRMNTWVFGQTQRQIDYKARWDGVPLWYVNPRGTSRNCPDCGSCVARLAGRQLYCPKCDKTWDRDVLASRNIMACAVPQARPSRGSDEGERGDDGSNPLSRWREAKPYGHGPEGEQDLNTLRRTDRILAS